MKLRENAGEQALGAWLSCSVRASCRMEFIPFYFLVAARDCDTTYGPIELRAYLPVEGHCKALQRWIARLGQVCWNEFAMPLIRWHGTTCTIDAGRYFSTSFQAKDL